MRIKVLFLICFYVTLGSRSALSQEAVFGNVELYKAVLHELFANNASNFADHTKESAIVLRFSSSASREMQIMITQRKSQKPEIVLWRVPRGQPGIWDQVAQVSSRLQSEDPSRVAAAIHIERSTLPQPSEQLLQLVNRFSSLRFSPSLNRGLVIDPGDYDLWFESMSNRTHFSLQGSPFGEPSDHPLVLWMIAIRTEVDRK